MPDVPKKPPPKVLKSLAELPTAFQDGVNSENLVEQGAKRSSTPFESPNVRVPKDGTTKSGAKPLQIAPVQTKERAKTATAPRSKLSVGTARTPTFKPAPSEIIRQEFSHGRAKSVVLEKVVRRRIGTDPDLDAASRLLDFARRTGKEELDLSELTELRQLPKFRASDNLIVLNLRGTKVFDLGPVTALKRLTHLDITKTNVSSLAAVSELTHLQSLHASDTRIDDLTPLVPLKQLRTLVCANTGVSDLSPLSSTTNLEQLTIDNTPISTLQPIYPLTKIKKLYLSNTAVTDLSPLAGKPALLEGAREEPHSLGVDFRECPITDPALKAIAIKSNPDRTLETLRLLESGSPDDANMGDVEDLTAPPVEAIPAQNRTAIGFTSAISGPLDLLADAASPQFDPEQSQLYSRMRDQLSSIIEEIPTQERMQITATIEDFLAQPANWTDVHFKKLLWLCGNALRNILGQHDIVSSDPEPHYAKLPPATGEALRRPVETWNIVVIGDPILRDLDAQRLGPKESVDAKVQLDAARPILEAAMADRKITTENAALTVKTSLSAAEISADNIHTRQAQALARDTSQNLIVQILRGAYRITQDIRNPQTDEAKFFVKEYKAGIYKKIGEWTVTGSVAAAGVAATLAGTMVYQYGVPFFEFVTAQSSFLKAYLPIAFENRQLVQMVDWMVAARLQLLDAGREERRT